MTINTEGNTPVEINFIPYCTWQTLGALQSFVLASSSRSWQTLVSNLHSGHLSGLPEDTALVLRVGRWAALGGERARVCCNVLL